MLEYRHLIITLVIYVSRHMVRARTVNRGGPFSLPMVSYQCNGRLARQFRLRIHIDKKSTYDWKSSKEKLANCI